MIVKTQNGWPALAPDSSYLHVWNIPAKNGSFKLKLRNGSAGFVLAHLALSISELVEDVTNGPLDDWGYAYREIRDGTDLSNHSSGTAIDINALKHILGKHGTWTIKQETKIDMRLIWMRGVIRWGADYERRPDEMHFEIVQSMREVERVAHMLMDTPRGERLLKVNPGQRKVILS